MTSFFARWRGWRRFAMLLAVLVFLCSGGSAGANQLAVGAEEVKPAHETIDANGFTDDLGIFVGVPVSHPARRYPALDEFPSGPDVGQRLPEFTLPNQHGEPVDFHADRGKGKAVVVFYRSADW